MAKRPKRSTSLGDDAIAEPEAMSIVPVEHVQSKILIIRGQKVILDADLAGLYGVQTRVLVQAVKRNIGRFPPDFMFQLDKEEFNRLKSQTVISNGTEHGAIMAAGVLNSERAVQASIFVVRAFVRLKQMLGPYKELSAKLDRLEQKVQGHDKDIVAIVDAIRLLMPPPEEPPPEPFGFRRARKH